MIISSSVSSRYIKPIDGLRALSIILVIFFHANLFEGRASDNLLVFNILNSFDAGVSFFFLISGFLITGILVDTKNQEGFFKKFYARRFLRIFPLYYLILIGAFFIVPLFDHSRVAKWATVDSTWYWLFLSNYYIAFKGQFQHGLVDLSWSLSIEEQFYLVWPFVVYYLKPKNILRASLLGITLSLVLRIYFRSTGASDLLIHLFTFSRLDGLCLGAILALGYRGLIKLPELSKIPVFIGVMPLLLHYFFLLNTSSASIFLRGTFSYTLVALFFAFFFMKVISGEKSLFNNSLLITVGKYSYGIYLTHYPIASYLRPYFQNYFDKYYDIPLAIYGTQLIYVLIVLIGSLAISYAIFHFYEKHFLKLKKFFEY